MSTLSGITTAMACIIGASIPTISAADNSVSSSDSAQRTAVIAMGICDNHLANTARIFRDQTRALPGTNLLNESDTASIAPIDSISSLEEIQQLLAFGKTDYLYDRNERAEKRLLAALSQINKIPVGKERWDTYWHTLGYLGQLNKKVGNLKKATEYFRAILKTDETFRLDKEFPPSTRNFFEDIKSSMTNEPHSQMLIKSRPSGATVFINGFPAGKTPLEKPVVDGEYEVMVVKDEQRGFVRKTVVRDDHVLVEIDLEQESLFHPDFGPCYAENFISLSLRADLGTHVIPPVLSPPGRELE